MLWINDRGQPSDLSELLYHQDASSSQEQDGDEIKLD